MKKIKLIFALALVAYYSPVLAQTDFDIDLENLFYETDISEFDYDTYLESFEELKERPLKINSADAQELEDSKLFTNEQVANIISYRELAGKLISIYELQAIPGLSPDFIHKILPFIQVNNHIDDYQIPFSKLISKGNYQVILRYQQSFPNKIAYQNSKYIGHPSKIYTRYKYNYSNKFSYGITAEKDQGEAMFKEKSKLGFDFYSFHLFWKVNTKIKALALGDYQVNLGQGLVLWTGFGFNKTTNAMLVKKEAAPIQAFTSVNEFAFFRGIAAHFKIKKFELIPFFSLKKIDANLSYTDSTNTELSSSRIALSGYHRTPTELESKHANLELKTGAHLKLNSRNKHLGYSILYTHLQKELRFSSKAYNQFQFQGKQLINQSLDYHIILKRMHFFGESALSLNKSQAGFAMVHGLLINPDKKIDISIVHRYYQAKYQSLYYTKAFGESTSPSNEHGIYFGLQMKIFKNLSLNTYFDLYTFPWLAYQKASPTKGRDFQILLSQKISKSFSWYISFKNELKETSAKIQLGDNNAHQLNKDNLNYLQAYFGEDQISSKDELLEVSSTLSKQEIEAAKFITPTLNQSIRFHIAYSPVKYWHFQTRIQVNHFYDKINPKENGFMAYQDIQFKSLNCPFSFSTRISYFDIPSYSSRVYSYENDVLFQFSIPSLYQQGIRVYLNLQYALTKNLQIWLRASHSYYSSAQELGSGNDKVLGNKTYDLKAQVRLKF